MTNIHYGAHGVKTELPHITTPFAPLNGASAIEWFQYFDEIAQRKVTQAVGYSNGIACSDRTRAGKLHESDGFNVRDNLLGTLDAKGYHGFLIRITWKRSGRLIHYSTPIDTIYKFGEQQDRYDGLQWHLPLCYWSIDGAAPVGAAVVAEEVPTVEQPMLFDYAEPVKRWGGAY